MENDYSYLAKVIQVSWELEQVLERAKKLGISVTYKGEIPVNIDDFDYTRRPETDKEWVEFLTKLAEHLFGKKVSLETGFLLGEHKMICGLDDQVCLASATTWEGLEKSLYNKYNLSHEESH